MSNKNIVLCADGTGNLGGTTPDTNVYRLFNMVDIHNPAHPQMTYYDNGVGTATNKYWRMISGAFGFGFKGNVCELYEFLARQYVPGDQVFLFGFSRGAAEVRALSGMIACAGLVNGTELNEEDLKGEIKKAYSHYKNKRTELLFPEPGAIPVTFIGVWDTVSALGFPKEWRVIGIGMFLLNFIFYVLDHVFDWILPHNFYNYELTPNVQNAYHALAIDDERLSFTPKVWNETIVGAETRVEQVWFGGAHSNVGGGYGRAGLSYVVLQWMLSKAVPLGLILTHGSLEEVQDKKNAYGRMYNARDGFGLFYRYYPRKITELCLGKLRGKIKIHKSVFDRIKRFTEHYAPGHLPKEFEIIQTASGQEREPLAKDVSIQETQWDTCQKELDTWTFRRSWLYGIFLELFLTIVISALYVWNWPITYPTWTGIGSGPLHHVADVATYILPKIFENFIHLVVLQRPILFLILLSIIIVLFRLRGWTRKNYREVSEKICKIILKASS